MRWIDWLNQLTVSAGIDVSHYEKTIDWAAVRSSGVRFAYIKATEGTGFIDPFFRTNWASAQESGLLRGAFHFFKANEPVEEQVKLFLDTVGTVGRDDLPPALDLEKDPGWAALTPSERVDRALAWLAGVQSALNVVPVIYTGPSFAVDTLGSDRRLKPFPLWLAHYTQASQPAVPTPWSAWDYWQYTNRGSVPGVTGFVDLDRHNGLFIAQRIHRQRRRIRVLLGRMAPFMVPSGR